MHSLRLVPSALICLVAGALLWSGARQADDDFYAMRKNFELFGSVYEEVVGTYMSRVDPERFMRTGVDAMLGTLDPWTDFLDEADNVAIDLAGRRLLGDVGLNLGRRGGAITVLVPDAAAGAYRQGVQTGDVVLRVAGQRVDSLSIPNVRSLLRGEPGTVVDVEVHREGAGQLGFALKREAPAPRSVPFAERLAPPHEGIAYLRLDRFGGGASSELSDALEELGQSGAIRGVVLDLRGNPGGLLSEGIAVSQLFLPRGALVVSTRGRAPESNRAYHSADEPVVPDELPIAVLMDRYSASASEIVAGALQDHDRAVMVGESSFGKGLVQVLKPLPYNTSIKITMARYYTPSGRGIRRDDLESRTEQPSTFRTDSGRPLREGAGVEPDIAIPAPIPGPLEKALDREAAFFLFAGSTVAERGEELQMAASRSGRLLLPDGTLESFEAWLEGRGFEFRTPFEEALGSVGSVDQGPQVTAAWDRLLSEAARYRGDAFQREGERLLVRIGQEVSARVLGPVENRRAGLGRDEVLGAAIEVLEAPQRYRDLLNPR